MPTYNRTHYFREALESAVRQTFTEFDILITDNHSDPVHWEDIAAIIEEVNDPRIRVRRNKRNVGPLRNVVTAAQSARGRYIAILHDDDVWEPNFLKRMVPVLESHPAISIGFSDHYLIDATSQIRHEATEKNSKHWNRDTLDTGIYQPFYEIGLIWKAVPAHMAAVIRKSAIDWEDFPEAVGHADDLWLTYLACREGQAAYYVDDRLTRYRVHDEMLTATAQAELHQGTEYCYKHFLKDEKLDSIHDRLKGAYCDIKIHEALGYLKEGKREQARHILTVVLEERQSVKAWLGMVASLMPKSIIGHILAYR